jgi:hypothetical protein
LEASRGARESPSWLWCLIPACVRVEAWAATGVVVPDDSGVTAMGAIVCLCDSRFWDPMGSIEKSLDLNQCEVAIGKCSVNDSRPYV